MKTKKRLLSILLTLALVLGLMPGMSLTALAANTIEKTVTWTSLSGTGSMSSDGVTLTCSASPPARIGGNFYSGRGGFTFSSDEGGTIKKIEITGTENITLTGSSSTVTSDFRTYSVSKIVFTIEIVPATGVTLNPSTAQTIEVGGSVAFTATVEPSNASDKKVKWSTTGGVTLYSDSNCTQAVGTTATSTLTVYAKGTSAGSATVTVTTNDANKTANCAVTVTKSDPTAPTGLTATYGQTLVNVELPEGWSWVPAATTSVGSVGSNTFKANFAGNDNYNAASNMDVTVTVSAADPEIPTGLTATYGQTLADVALPDDWAWATSSTSVGDVGTNTFKADYTTTSTNYNSKTDVDVEVTVSAADPTTPTGLTATYGQTLADVTLPDGWAWADSTTSVGNAGTNTFKANYTATSTNYNSKSDVDVSVTVSAADPEIPTGLTATYGQTLADVALPDDWAWSDSTTSVGNVGKNTFKANYTAPNTNYNSKTDVDVEVTVGKANAVPATVTANNRTYDGAEKPLVTVTGEPTGGTMQYALGTATEATQPYTTSIPTATNAGTYYVWYKVIGDPNHNDSVPACVTINISYPVVVEDPVKQVIDKIDALSEPYDEAKVKEAREAFENLDKVQKEDPRLTADVMKKLTDAEEAIESGKAQKAAGEVSAMIEALADPSKATADQVANAVAAYKALSDKAKALITDDELSTLQAAVDYPSASKKAFLKSIKAKKGRKAVVKWKKKSAVNGYQLVYSTSKKFKKKATKKVSIKSYKTIKKTVKKLKKGKKYYFRIRTYTKAENISTGKTRNVYGKWSKVKKIKAR